MRTLSILAAFSAAALLIAPPQPAVAADQSAELWTKRDAAVAKAVDFLAKAQSPEGAFTPQAGPAVTALVTAAPGRPRMRLAGR